MKLASVYFDDIVCIPGAKDGGSAVPRQVLRESNFHAADGWDIERGDTGVISLFREGMPDRVYAAGYGCSFVVDAGTPVHQTVDVGSGAENNEMAAPSIATNKPSKRGRK